MQDLRDRKLYRGNSLLLKILVKSLYDAGWKHYFGRDIESVILACDSENPYLELYLKDGLFIIWVRYLTESIEHYEELTDMKQVENIIENL